MDGMRIDRCETCKFFLQIGCVSLLLRTRGYDVTTDSIRVPVLVFCFGDRQWRLGGDFQTPYEIHHP